MPRGGEQNLVCLCKISKIVTGQKTLLPLNDLVGRVEDLHLDLGRCHVVLTQIQASISPEKRLPYDALVERVRLMKVLCDTVEEFDLHVDYDRRFIPVREALEVMRESREGKGLDSG